MICPTCQIVFAGTRMPAAAGLLCMGLFSIFWLGAGTTSALRLACRAVALSRHHAAISSGSRAPVMKATASDMV